MERELEEAFAAASAAAKEEVGELGQAANTLHRASDRLDLDMLLSWTLPMEVGCH